MKKEFIVKSMCLVLGILIGIFILYHYRDFLVIKHNIMTDEEKSAAEQTCKQKGYDDWVLRGKDGVIVCGYSPTIDGANMYVTDNNTHKTTLMPCKKPKSGQQMFFVKSKAYPSFSFTINCY